MTLSVIPDSLDAPADLIDIGRGGSDPAFATTLAHGLKVLEAFRNSTGPLSNGEIAKRTDLSRPTVSRFVHTLQELGYLRRDASGRYMPDVGTLAIAYPLLASLKIRQLARPLMREFASFAGGTVSIAAPYGLDYIYLETMRTKDSAAHVPDIGYSSSLATTAVGRALLSLYTADELGAFIARMERERPDEWRSTEGATLAAIEKCRERGFALSIGEWRPEIYGVGAPIYRTKEGQCLAVNCGIPAYGFSPDQIEKDCGPRMLGLARSIRALVPDQ